MKLGVQFWKFGSTFPNGLVSLVQQLVDHFLFEVIVEIIQNKSWNGFYTMIKKRFQTWVLTLSGNRTCGRASPSVDNWNIIPIIRPNSSKLINKRDICSFQEDKRVLVQKAPIKKIDMSIFHNLK